VRARGPASVRAGRLAAAGAGVLSLLSACGGGHGFGIGGFGHGPMANLSAAEKAFIEAAPTWDLDKDGVVTCEEWKQYAADLFRQADADKDGQLTREEFQAVAEQDRLFVTADFDYFDADADGRVSLAEFADKPNPAFVLLDKDNDCRLTSDEMRAGASRGEGHHRSGGGYHRGGAPDGI
jgi:Ca2+-binding EF-hand superfamily protein